MANVARIDAVDGKRVRARDAISRGHTFYCNNRGCGARLHLCKEGTNSPYFASYRREEHRYDFCLDEHLSFNPDQVDEAHFNLANSIRNICKTRDNDIHNQLGAHRGGVVGTGRRIGLNTAKGLYGMCEYVGCGNYYNNIPIDEIYLCQENRVNYINSLNGFCIVKARYRRKVDETIEFMFDVNDDDCITLAAIFNSEKAAWNFYNRIKKRNEFKNLTYVIAGEWEISNNGTHDYTCHVNKQSQIFFVAD